MYGKMRILEFCSTSLVGEIRKWVYGTYPEATPLSYYFFNKTCGSMEIDEKETFWKIRLFLPFLDKNVRFWS